jgi:hypothetical protein
MQFPQGVPSFYLVTSEEMTENLIAWSPRSGGSCYCMNMQSVDVRCAVVRPQRCGELIVTPES